MYKRGSSGKQNNWHGSIYTRVSNIKGVKGKGSTAEHNTGKLEIFPCVT